MGGTKRPRPEDGEGDNTGDGTSGQRIVSGGHPHGVKPWGTLMFGNPQGYRQAVESRKETLGLFSRLDDALILTVLGSFNAKELCALCCASSAFLAYASHEELWRALAFEEFRTGDTRFFPSWKETYFRNRLQGRGQQVESSWRPATSARSKPVYSDLLYQSYYCANLEFPAEWTERENVPRRSGLSLEDFQRQYERPNQPVILTDVVRSWPAFERWGSRSYLNKAFENQLVHVGGYQFTMAQYYEYADEAGDEMPLYLFDKRFAEKSPRLAEDYHVPRAFSEDLFGVLGDCRPDYRWLIVGPKRSGSSFHKDPNATSAWNAVISGRKKWILFPPDFTPPGVHASDCGLHVATSVSIIEWFLNFYDEARDSEVQPRECVVEAGECIFVPRGWWHLVLNLEESVAITQNFASSVNVNHVLRYVENADLVSGLEQEKRAGLHSAFKEALRLHRPEVLEGAARRGPKAKGRLAGAFEKGGEGAEEKESFRFNFLG